MNFFLASVVTGVALAIPIFIWITRAPDRRPAPRDTVAALLARKAKLDRARAAR